MSSIVAAIHADIAEYEALCRKYGEPIQYAPDSLPDCYGEHADELKARASREPSHG